MPSFTLPDNKMSVWRAQRGLSLIELMIALVLSTLLTLGILTMYLDSNETSRLSRSLARTQESGRIALDIIRRDVRMSGFLGCSDPLQDLKPSFNASSLDADFFGNSIRGVRVGSDAWSDDTDYIDVSGIDDDAISGTDVVQVRRANGPSATLESEMASPTSVLDTDSEDTVTNFRLGEQALITNCVNADVFAVDDNSSVDDDKVNHAALSSTYPEGAQIFHFSTNTYWVKNTGRDGADGNDVFALYRDGDELVSGVEWIQVLYGVRDDATDKVRFVGAEDVGNGHWNEVDAIRIGVLISDDQNVLEAADKKSYELPGVTVSPADTAGATATYPDDRRLRSAFSTTIKLRNLIQEG